MNRASNWAAALPAAAFGSFEAPWRKVSSTRVSKASACVDPAIR